MKLVRYGNEGSEQPGLIDDSGILRDLSQHIPDMSSTALSDSSLEKLRKIETSTLVKVEGTPRFAPIISNIGKFLCIGLNLSLIHI